MVSVYSAGNLIVTEGNTLLAEEEVEMMTVLRINRDFMQYMRKTYGRTLQAKTDQNHNMTVVDVSGVTVGGRQAKKARR